MLTVQDLTKRFTLHLHGATVLTVVEGLSFEVHPGEVVALTGPTGAGKSTVLRCCAGGYRIDAGSIRLSFAGMSAALDQLSDRQLVAVRRHAMAVVSQFLRVIPRIPTLTLVAEPLVADGWPPDQAQEAARALLTRLRVPEALWPLPPASFSGGEQQRVNLARGLVASRPLLLLDEPTASLDRAHAEPVLAQIDAWRSAGAAILLISHDPRVHDEVVDRAVAVEPMSALPQTAAQGPS